MALSPQSYSFKAGGHDLLALMRPLSADSDRGWVHLATAGKWEGHHQGEFEMTPDTFKRVLANFSKRSTPVKFDYEHDTHKEGVMGPRPSSGHIHKLETRNGGTELWGFVEFTPKAAQMVKDKEYNFTSVVIDFESSDRKTGKDIGPELISAALTDTPFIDGLSPIQLSEVSMSDDEKREATEEEPKEATEEEVEATEDEEVEATEEESEETTEAAEDSEPDFNAFGARLAEASGLDVAAALALADESIEEMTAILQEKADRDGTQSEASAKHSDAVRALVETQTADMRRELSELRAKEAAREEARIVAKADELINDGYARDGQRDHLIAALKQDEERTLALFSEKVVPVRQMQAGQEHTADPKTVELSTLPDQTQMNVRSLVAAGYGNERECIAQALKMEKN